MATSSRLPRGAWSIGPSGPVLGVAVWSALSPGAAHADDTLMPRIVHEACSEYEKGKSFTITARFEDESQLFDPKVMFRVRADTHWRPMPFTKDTATDNFVAVLAAKDLRGPLEYFIEVFDEFGNGPARMGSPEAPIRVVPARSPAPCQQVPVPIAPPTIVDAGPVGAATPFVTTPAPPPAPGACDGADRPLYCEPWLWAAVGTAVLAGVGVTVYFVAFAGEEEPPQTRDSVRLIVVGPDPTDNGLRQGRWP